MAVLLSSLRSRELIFRRENSSIAGAREYLFKHEVLRDVTYESIPLRMRRVYHDLVAEWLMEHSVRARQGSMLGRSPNTLSWLDGKKKQSTVCCKLLIRRQVDLPTQKPSGITTEV